MRLLSSSRAASASRTAPPPRASSSNRRADKTKPEIIFHLPGFGIQYLPAPPPRYDLEAQRLAAKELQGDLEVRLPLEMGPRRCRRLRMGLKTVVRLAMGDGRGWEEDVVSEMELELGTMLYLRPGSNQFPFTFKLDPYMPPHDWHPQANLQHILWAEMEGTHTSSSLLPKAFRFSSRSPSASRHQSPIASPAHSPIASRSSSPTRPMPLPDLSALKADLPRIPSYEQSELDAHRHEDVPIIEGVFKNSRQIRVAINPSTTGEVSALDDRLEGVASGLGAYKIHLRSPLWVVNAFLYTRLRVRNIPPTVTIFDLRISIIQNVVLSSPRDPPGVTLPLRKTFVIHKEGSRPTSDVCSVLWRGEIAGGTDGEEWTVETKERIPDDTELRPSTLDGIQTPITVSHHIIIEVTFAVWGENADGTVQTVPNSGEARRLRLSRNVVVPSCKNIPQVLDLPEYETSPANLLTQPNNPCPLCKVEPMDRACTTCPFDASTHPRHDHPTKLVGTADGTCPVCSVLMVEKDVNWVVCACAIDDPSFEALGTGALGSNAVQDGARRRVRAWSMSSAVWREADAGGMGEGRGQKEEYAAEDRGRDRSRR